MSFTFEQVGNGIIFNGDCFEIIPYLSTQNIKFNLLCTDPPYDVSVNHDGGKLYHNRGFTKSTIDVVNLKINNGYDIVSFKNLIKDLMYFTNCYFFCNKKQIPNYFKTYIENNKDTFEILTWHKNNALPTYKGKYLTDTEYCLYFFEKGHKLCNPNNYEDAKTFYIAPINSKDKKEWKHPTIKPLELVEKLIRNSTNEGDLVIDPFMGSGTTCVACQNLNRRFIGIELDTNYYNIAKQRIQETIK